MNWIGLVLGVPAVALSLAELVGGHDGFLVVGHFFEAALYFYAASGLIVHMLWDTDVTMDDLLAVGATFTLLAWALAYVYSACQYFIPGSLAPDSFQGRGWSCSFSASASSSASG